MTTTLSIACSETPVARWYRDIVTAVERCAPSEARFDPSAHAPAILERLRRLWLHRMVSEHRSTAVFASLGWQLMEAGATLDMKAMVLSMAHDELRHTELCGRVAEALGAESRVELDVAYAQMPAHKGCTPEVRALRNVIYGSCLSEVVNSARFVALLDVTTEPFLRDATRRLLADEVTHGQFGFHYLEAWRPWLDAHPEVRVALGRYLRYGFAVYERDMSGGRGPFAKLSEEELAVGIPDMAVTRDVFYQTIEHAVIPGLERFGIEAGDAWRRRALTEAPSP